jgi:hypothetical protein
MRSFDYNKFKNYQWDSEVLGLVAQIHEFKGRQEMYLKQKPATLEKLIEIAKVQSTEASNKIEGIVTTSTRIQQLCMATRRQISDAAGIGGDPAHPITLQQFYQKQKEPIQIDSFQSKYVYRSSLSRRL